LHARYFGTAKRARHADRQDRAIALGAQACVRDRRKHGGEHVRRCRRLLILLPSIFAAYARHHLRDNASGIARHGRGKARLFVVMVDRRDAAADRDRCDAGLRLDMRKERDDVRMGGQGFDVAGIAEVAEALPVGCIGFLR
jgi:hypothetical protein